MGVTIVNETTEIRARPPDQRELRKAQNQPVAKVVSWSKDFSGAPKAYSATARAITAITGEATRTTCSDIVRSALNDGVVGYLRKPVDEQYLLQCLHAALTSGEPTKGAS